MKHPRAAAPAAIRNVLLVAKPEPASAVELAGAVAAWLEERKVQVRFDEDTSRALHRKEGVPRGSLPPGVDLVMVAGGDGTLLSVARLAAPRGVPVLGVNLGGLGFLTELQPEEVYAGLERVLSGEYHVEERQMLRARFLEGGRVTKEFALLNDVVITKSALARMIELELTVDGEEVATYMSDGLIIASPTGSTAYNLSAGGPILDPRMRAFIISPICPHAMTFRPLVVPPAVTLEARLKNAQKEVYLTLDGQVGFPMRQGDRVQVDEHPSALKLLRVTRRSFFEVLRKKLRWGER